MRKNSKKQTDTKRDRRVVAADLDDLGLEPPKLYRDSQRKIVEAQTNRSNRAQSSKPKKTPTRQETRQKQTARRKKKNKFRKIVIWFLVGLVLVATGVVLSLTVFFNVDNITVVGNERYSTEEILAHCTIDTGENMFLADTRSAISSLEQNLPYIYKAEIHRKLPSSIEIEITEGEAAYYIKNKDKSCILLDDNFKVLESEAEKGKGIRIKKAEIALVIPGQKIKFADEDISDCLTNLSDVIRDNNFTEFTEIYSKNISDNYIVYDGRITFKLGTCDNLENKIMQGLTACSQLDETSPNAKGTMTINGGKQVYFTED